MAVRIVTNYAEANIMLDDVTGAVLSFLVSPLERKAGNLYGDLGREPYPNETVTSKITSALEENWRERLVFSDVRIKAYEASEHTSTVYDAVKGQFRYDWFSTFLSMSITIITVRLLR